MEHLLFLQCEKAAYVSSFHSIGSSECTAKRQITCLAGTTVSQLMRAQPTQPEGDEEKSIVVRNKKTARQHTALTLTNAKELTVFSGLANGITSSYNSSLGIHCHRMFLNWLWKNKPHEI